MGKLIDLTGKKFSKLVVLRKAEKRSKDTYYICRCECGEEKEIRASHLTGGKITSCGCARRNNLVSQKFGRLTVIERVENDRGGNTRWLCKCDCGSMHCVISPNLKSGDTRSCGCLHEEVNGTHRKSNTPEYRIWNGIHQRCKNPNREQYVNYGKRNIKVSERWNSFENFLADMGKRPSPKHSIERIDVNGDYTPSNCTWATSTEQSRNKRKYKNNQTGYVGIQKRKDNGKYRVGIRVNGKQIPLGTFTNLQEAIEAREHGEKLYWKSS